jgi:hypothetical protein
MSTLPAPTTELGHAGVDTAAGHYGFAYQSSLHREDVTDLMWPRSIRTYDRIRRTDSKVSSSIRAMLLPLLSADWRIDPRGARPDVVQRVADSLNLPIIGDDERPPTRTRDRFDWGFHLRHALLSRVWGFTPFEQVARALPDGFIGIRKLAVRMPHLVGNLQVANDGGLEGIWQKSVGSTGRGVFIPVDRLVMYVHDREGADWRGQSILRAVYREFLLKDHAHRVGAVHIDRNGSGVPVINDDPEAADPATEAAANQRLASAIRSGAQAGGRLSSGANLKIHGVDGSTPDIIAFIRLYDEAIAQNVLDNFSSLPSAPNGSRALGASMIDFFVRALNAHGNDIAQVCTAHVVEDLVDWNWGVNEPAPAVVHGEIGADQQLTATSIKQLIDSRAITPDPALEAYLRRYYKLPAIGAADVPATADGGTDQTPESEGVDT